MKKSIDDCDVIEILEQWGRWSNSGLGAGSLEQPQQDNTHWISDEIGLRVDSAVSNLKFTDTQKKISGIKKNIDRYKAIKLYYKSNYNIPMLANALKVGENKAVITLRAGESFIEAFLRLHQIKKPQKVLLSGAA